MKTLTILLAASLCVGTPVFAGKATKAGAGRVAIPIRKIDADGNHKIEGAEIAALKDAFAKAPADNRMRKRLDTNGDGKLEDNEIAALNARLAKHAEARHADKGAGKKKGKAA